MDLFWKVLIIVTIVCLVLCSIPYIIYYAVLKPLSPIFTLENASVTGFNLTSNAHLTSFFNIEIKVNNPNPKIKLDYSAVRVKILKDEEILTEDVLDDFAQPKGTVTLLRFEMAALNVSLDKGPRFNLELESGLGYVYFNVFLASYMNSHNLEVTCSHVVANITMFNSLVASSPADSYNANKKFKSSSNCSVYFYLDGFTV